MKQYWSSTHQTLINAAIQHAQQDNIRAFATFDADNTIWKYDLAEALLAWMSARGRLDIRTLDAHVLPYPLRDGETLISYYDYLCDIDHALGYLFASQAVAGFTLGTLRAETDEMLASQDDILAPMPNGAHRAVPVPRIFPAQVELIATLQRQGVEVWIVSASLEELVRMVASDPKYGINIPPERVIGVNLMLQKPDGRVTVGAMERRAGKTGVDHYLSAERMRWTLTSHPFSPMTWYGGKVAAILEWIDDSQRPILVAGDSPNDFYMQFHAGADDGGVRLRIHRSQAHRDALHARIAAQQNGNLNPCPERGWIEVTAEDLGVKA